MCWLFALCVAAACPLGSATALRRGGGGARSVTDPATQDAVDCSNEVNRLSEESNRLLSEHQHIDRRCADAKKYYSDMIDLVEKSIARLEKNVAAQDTDDEVAEVYRERYTAQMCAKVHEAFFMEDKDARLEVLRICMGVRSLAPDAFLVGHNATAEKPCQLAQDMQDKVDALRAAKAEKAAKCREDKLKLKNELDEKRAEQGKLEDQYYGHHGNTAAIKSQVADEVKDKFCPVILSNYKFNEDEIKQFWSKSCPA